MGTSRPILNDSRQKNAGSSFALSCLLANTVLLVSDCSADEFLLMLNLNTDGSDVFLNSKSVLGIIFKLS